MMQAFIFYSCLQNIIPYQNSKRSCNLWQLYIKGLCQKTSLKYFFLVRLRLYNTYQSINICILTIYNVHTTYFKSEYPRCNFFLASLWVHIIKIPYLSHNAIPRLTTTWVPMYYPKENNINLSSTILFWITCMKYIVLLTYTTYIPV